MKKFTFEPDICTIGEGEEKFMVHLTVSSTDAYRGSGHYNTRYFPTKYFKAENFFQLVHILDNNITKFLIEKWFIKKDQGYTFRMVSHVSIDFEELCLMQNLKTSEVEWNLGEGIGKLMGI